ncbi:kinase-like domain-containing protein [Gorgonomyces haynaldii]|nr:kinase-like domain-containing protein [Gorgonomyces haynaldii]
MNLDAAIVDFSYLLTSELNVPLSLRITEIQGHWPEHSLEQLKEDPYLYYKKNILLSMQLYANNKPLTLKIKCSSLNEWITFPIMIKDIPQETQLVVDILDTYLPRKPLVVGGCTMALFGSENNLKQGIQKLYIWPFKEGDPSYPTSTPPMERDSEAERLEKMVQKHKLEHSSSDWLDARIQERLEQLNVKEWSSNHLLYLFVQLTSFDFPIVFHEPLYPSILRPLKSLSVFDPESINDNPVESKHRKLSRSHRTGPLDRELKPNAKIRDDLYLILRYPPTKELSAEESDLLWKFRFYLTRDKKALTKFLKAVDWKDKIESKQAVDLLGAWVDVDIEDALELLGPGFKDPHVRSFAVRQLRKADDDELQLYLLQLVQALKFEDLGEHFKNTPLVQFLIERALENPILGNYLYWYLMVESEDKQFGKRYGRVAYQFLTLMMEKPDGNIRRDQLRRQGELVSKLEKLSKELRLSKDPRPRKIEKLQSYIADPRNGLLSFEPLPLPLDASVQVTGIVPEKATMFKSNLLPFYLVFTCLDGSEYHVMFKTGDDLRQDQLVVQLITLMDRLLRKENLDLRLTPYKVLATGADHGMIQFIKSKAIANLLAESGNSLVPYLKSDGEIPPQVLDTYIRSTSGYCVMTYLLGIGDRHLDNLLMTKDGHLFHIDFGFILGRDPKPFPPPMKLCKEMVDVLGGTSSQSYQLFQSHCFIAYNSLRKSANLILNLFSLMVKANVPDIAIEPDKAVTKVQERFRLDLNDEEAIQFFQSLIIESVGAFFPQVMEQMHKIAQLWRS